MSFGTPLGSVFWHGNRDNATACILSKERALCYWGLLGARADGEEGEVGMTAPKPCSGLLHCHRERGFLEL